MADMELTELNSGGAVGDEDLLLTRQNGAAEDKKITAAQIRTYARAGLTTDSISEGDGKFVSAAQKTKLDGIETGATADQTGAEIKTAYEGQSDTNAYTDAEKAVVADAFEKSSDSADDVTQGSTTNFFMTIGSAANTLKGPHAGTVAGGNSIGIGNGASTTLENCIAIGTDAVSGGTGSDTDNVAIGLNATADGRHSIAIGPDCTSSGTNSVVIGDDSTSTTTKTVTIGNGHANSGDRSIAIGDVNTITSADNCVVLGHGITVPNNTDDCIVIGDTPTISTGHSGCILIGQDIVSNRADSFQYGDKWLFVGGFTTSALAAAGTKAQALVFDTDTSQLKFHNGSSWKVLGEGGGSDISVEDEGGEVLSAVTSFDFVGTGVTVTDGGSGTATVTIAGGAAPVDSVNGQAGTVVLDADDIDDTSTTNKFATAAQLSKLDGIATGATANSSDATLLARANHTGTQVMSTISDAGALASLDTVDTAQIDDDAVTIAKLSASGTASSSTFLRGDGSWASPAGGGGGDLLASNNLSDLDNAGTARTNLGLEIGADVQAYSAVLAATTASFTSADETKLDGIATGATANSSDATLLARANHTGTQAMSTISDAGALATLDTVDTAQIDDDAVTAAKLADTYVETDTTGVTGADAITNIMSLTTAEYGAITPNASTLYIITDAS